MQPGDLVHRVAGKHLMPHRETERKPQHDAGLLGPVVASLRELLQELVAPGDPDLPQSQVRERREHERLHVPLIQLPSPRRDPALQLQVLEPIRDRIRESAIRAERRI